MAILKVARMGHPVLRARAQALDPAQIASAPVQQLIDDMIATMREYSGIGLAAPQIHQSVRIFVAGFKNEPLGDDIPADKDMPLIALINPEVAAASNARAEDWEGCLSIPDIRGRVVRARDVRVKAYDREGKRVEFRASGLPARVIQHETDHLDGVLFFDRMKSFETRSFLDEYSRFWAKDDEDDEKKTS